MPGPNLLSLYNWEGLLPKGEGGLGFLGSRPSTTLLPTSSKLLKQLLQTSTPQPEALVWAKQLEVQGGGLPADRWWGGIWGFCLGKKNKSPWSSFSLGLKRG